MVQRCLATIPASAFAWSAALLRSWAIVCAANFVGAAGLAPLVWRSAQSLLNQGNVGRAAVRIAMSKAELPVTAFVAAGFEHSIASM